MMRLPFAEPLPDGFVYRDDFITVDEESSLADAIGEIDFSPFEMHGVVARRRVAFFGRSYDRGRGSTPPIPEFLFGLREKAAALADVDAAAFAMALVNEYPPGAPIGWHRDAPQYDMVVGVSLLSACRMKFRPYVSPGTPTTTTARRAATHELTLATRSGYLMAGPSRNAYEHHIPPVASRRYSITFRTLR